MSRPGYALGTKGGGGQVKTLIVPLSSFNLEAFVAGTAKVKMPESGQIIGIDLNVGGRGGTFATGTVDVLSGATSLLTAVFDVAAMTPGTAVVKEAAAFSATGLAVVAKDATLSVTAAVSGGSSPTWGRANVQIDYLPTGD